MAGPPIARGLGSALTKTGKALRGLKGAVPDAAPAEATSEGSALGTSNEPMTIAGQKLSPELAAKIRARNPEIGGGAPASIPVGPKSPVSTAAPSMPNAPSQNPGELWPYQSDAVQAKIQALRDAAPSTTAPQTAADMVNEVNVGSMEGRTTDRGTGSTPGGWADLANEMPHPSPNNSPLTPSGDVFDAEFGMPGSPASDLPPTMANDILARRLARLQSVFGGKQFGGKQ